jgi:hypothetical protein
MYRIVLSLICYYYHQFFFIKAGCNWNRVSVLPDLLLSPGISINLHHISVKNRHHLHSRLLASYLVYGTEGVERVWQGDMEI